MTAISFIFLILILWIISPIGILFFLASKTLFSKNTSVLKRKIAWVIQGIAFLMWTSLMSVMLVIHLDSRSYNIFGVGSAILDFAIISGFAFLFMMLAVYFLEKKVVANNKKNRANKNSEERKSDNNSAKIADAKTSNIKEKIRRKLKEDLKEIMDDEIERRL